MDFCFKKDDSVFFLIVLFLLLVVALATGFRPVNVGSDTALYSAIYEEALSGQELSHRFEFLYDLLLRVFSYFSLSSGVYFSFLSALSLLFLVLSFFNINGYFSRPAGDAGLFVYGLLLLTTSVFFYSAQVNVVRQGVSCFALFCFYSCLLNRRCGFLLFFSAFVALGFHSTAVMFVFLAFGLIFSYRIVLGGVVFFAVLYSLGGAELLLEQISNLLNFDLYGKVVEYGADAEYASGIRLDFVVFSLGLGFFLDFLGRFWVPSFQRERFLNCVKVYWLFLVPFFMLGFGAFSDRFLLNAWLYFSVALGVFLANFLFFKKEAHLFGSLLLIVAVVGYACFAQGVWQF